MFDIHYRKHSQCQESRNNDQECKKTKQNKTKNPTTGKYDTHEIYQLKLYPN